MCDKCSELDAKIEHYERLIDPAMDPLTTERAKRFIEEIRAERARLHSEQNV